MVISNVEARASDIQFNASVTSQNFFQFFFLAKEYGLQSKHRFSHSFPKENDDGRALTILVVIFSKLGIAILFRWPMF